MSAVRLVTAVLPAEIKPDSDLTGPEKVDLDMFSPYLNKLLHLGVSLPSQLK